TLVRSLRGAEGVYDPQPQGLPGALGEAAADDQVDTAAGAHLVQQHLGLELELGQQGAGFVVGDFALVGEDVDDLALADGVHGGLEHQGAGVFHGVVENGRHLATDTDAAGALVGHSGYVFTEEPEHGIGGGFAGGADAHHIPHKGDLVAAGIELFDLPDGADFAD